MGNSSDDLLLQNDNDVGDTAREIKQELLLFIQQIILDNHGEQSSNNDDDDDEIIGIINKAIKKLTEFTAFKLRNKKKRSLSSLLTHLNVPPQFLCPLSKEIMKDPVVLSSGQTYDRPFIHQWLKDGNRTCPQTQQVLSHTVLTPNHLVRELIAQWCEDHGIELPPPITAIDEGVLTDADRDHLNALLSKLSSSLSDQKEAAKKIRLLTKRMPSFRSFFGESSDAIPQLLSPLSASPNPDNDPELQEDLITAILNLSIHENNKKLIAEHPHVIPILVKSLRCGRIETRTNAAAALFTLSALDSNKHVIGNCGALKPLIDLLEEGDPLAMRDAASAIFNLCLVAENRARAVHDGAVRVLFHKIKDGLFVDELLTIMAMLALHREALEILVELNTVSCLLGIIRESTSQRNKENCVAILYSICLCHHSVLKDLRDDENNNKTISELAKHGTARAKRKAKSILDRLYMGPNLTHTA